MRSLPTAGRADLIVLGGRVFASGDPRDMLAGEPDQKPLPD